MQYVCVGSLLTLHWRCARGRPTRSCNPSFCSVPDTAPLFLDSNKAVDRFLERISGARAIAIDTEGASFHRFVDRIYLLQVATESDEAIIDPLRVESPTRLGSLLEDRNVEVVLHDADYDLRLLHQDYGWRVTNLFDTRVAAQLLGIRAFGLAALLERFFGVRLDKKHQRADWSMRPLTADMLDYAAQDTRYLLSLREQLSKELDQKGRLHWAREEFARAEGTRWEGENDGQSFLRLKGARDLNRRELARLRELVGWRDKIAAELDRATFRVASNEVLLNIARLAPSNRDALMSIKSFPRSMNDTRVQLALEAIARANALPESELPRFPKAARWERDPDFDERVTLLKNVRDAAAIELDLDPGVLCSRDRMESVARKRPSTIEELRQLPELRSWQVEVLGEGFLDALKSRTVNSH